jgi:hypothetical protein
LPALIVSGDSSPKQLGLMQASGFDCLSKPVPPARLHGWLVTARMAQAAVAARPDAALPMVEDVQ